MVRKSPCGGLEFPLTKSRVVTQEDALPSCFHLTWKPPEAASNKHPTAASSLGLKALGMRLQSFSKRQEKENPKRNEFLPVSVAWLRVSPTNPSGEKGLSEEVAPPHFCAGRFVCTDCKEVGQGGDKILVPQDKLGKGLPEAHQQR